MAKNVISSKILARLTQILTPKIFRGFYLQQMLEIVASCNCMQFQEKTSNPNSRKWQKKLIFGLIQAHWTEIRDAKTFFKNLASSVTRYHGQVSSCKISGKTNDPILRKFRYTERRTDRQNNESDFIGRCPTDFESPKFRSRDIQIFLFL